MKVQVRHGLAGAGAAGVQQVHAFVAAGLNEVPGHALHGAHHARERLRRTVEHIAAVGLGNGQHVAVHVPGDIQ